MRGEERRGLGERLCLDGKIRGKSRSRMLRMSTHELMPDANNVLILCIKINLFFPSQQKAERE